MYPDQLLSEVRRLGAQYDAERDGGPRDLIVRPADGGAVTLLWGTTHYQVQPVEVMGADFTQALNCLREALEASL